MSIEFTKSSKGKDVLRLNGNAFYKKFTRSNNIYWDCQFRRSKGCPSYAITYGLELIRSTAHNHSLANNLQSPRKMIFKDNSDKKNDSPQENSAVDQDNNSVDQQLTLEVCRQNIIKKMSLPQEQTKRSAMDSGENKDCSTSNYNHEPQSLQHLNVQKQSNDKEKQFMKRTAECDVLSEQKELELKKQLADEHTTKLENVEAIEQHKNVDFSSSSSSSSSSDSESTSESNSLSKDDSIFSTDNFKNKYYSNELENFDITNWNDPNLLVHRIRFLMHTALYPYGVHDAEIQHIIEELRGVGYIF